MKTSGKTSTTRRCLWWGKGLIAALVLVPGEAALAQNAHTLPLVLSASSQFLQGFVRVINRSERAGVVRIHAIDDTGERFGPVELSLDANAARQFNSRDLEAGNPGTGLSGGLGGGEGDWWLQLETELDIDPMAYVRTPDGFLTSVHDVARGESMTWRVPILNPASNTSLRSLLRVVNTSGIDTEVTIEGVDARGDSSPQGEVSFALPADGARTLSARELEAGYDPDESELPFDGRLGDGAGKWQLLVSAGRPIEVLSLMFTRSGHITNLSATRGVHPIRGSAGSDDLYGGIRDDVLDPGDNPVPSDSDRGWDTVYGSAGDDRVVYTGSGPTGWQELRYSELDSGGIRVAIDGAANRATVDKGSAGADTIVDIANPLNAGWDAGGFDIQGTRFDDVFDVDLDDEQWMDVAGGAGNDTINISSGGAVGIAYWYAPGGVDIDLGAGRASNDGYGDVDTINGEVWGVFGSESADTIRGSDNDERFYGRGGNDTIDGGGGFDRLYFGTYSSTDGDLSVDLAAGTATGTRNGIAFSSSISNIEGVFGAEGNDTLLGDDEANRLDGGAGNDVLNPRGVESGTETIGGSVGNDRIVYTDSGDSAYQWLYYVLLDTEGIRVSVDGAANHATVNKGAAGTDTIVDVVVPMESWGFGIEGTRFDDVFNVDLDDDRYQWMEVEGGAGNDIINIRPGAGEFGVGFYGSPSGVDVDLAAGMARNDGHGGVDTYNGDVLWVEGSIHADIIRGSDNDETFKGRGGNDTIDGGGGFDRLHFSSAGRANSIRVDLEEGTASGSRYGSAFTYALSNIERASGGDRSDTFIGSARDEQFDGRSGNDMFIFGAGHGNDVISDFHDGDTIVLRDMGVTKSQVLNAASDNGDGGVRIDLRSHGGGTITLWGFPLEDLDASDILL